jgi:hypothetical protein
MFFMLKCVKLIFFYFFKIIFEISASKRSETHKKKLIFNQFFFEFLRNMIFTRSNSVLRISPYFQRFAIFYCVIGFDSLVFF